MYPPSIPVIILLLTERCSAIKYTWQGGVSLALNKQALATRTITRAEYLECGSSWVAKKFAGLPLPPGPSGGSSAGGGSGGGSSSSASHKKRRVSDV